MLFEELDHRASPIGELSLRRRYDPRLESEVYEIKLGEEFLMSSYFTASEVALARLALAGLPGPQLDIAVGGLGLGYTSQAVLEHDSVHSLLTVEMLTPVIDWHRQGLLPIGRVLENDLRHRFVAGDFFALAASTTGLDPEQPGRTFDAILVDIDHTPEHRLDARHDSFYSVDGLRALKQHLCAGGLFGLWSNEAPDAGFVEQLGQAFDEVHAEPVRFHNPYQDREFVQSVYLARHTG